MLGRTHVDQRARARRMWVRLGQHLPVEARTFAPLSSLDGKLLSCCRSGCHREQLA
jgi:hypothetical protein